MKLSSGARRALPKSDFLGPGRTFPAPDKEHARKAIQLAPRSEHAGNITPSQEKSIVKKAESKLGHEGHHKVNSEHGSHVGAMMPHEKHTVHEDNVMHTMHMKHGATHPDSKGGKMHGDGSGHFSGH